MSCPAHEIAAVKGVLNPEQVDDLIAVAKSLPDRPILIYDLGSGSGVHTISVLQGRQKAVEIVSIDNREQEIFWLEVAMKNIKREKDWRGVIGSVFDKSLIPDKPIDLLIVDIPELSLDDILKLWKPALSPEGIIWNDRKVVGDPVVDETIVNSEEISYLTPIPEKELPELEESDAKEQEQTEERKETETQELVEKEPFHIGGIVEPKAKETPCENCGYMPAPEKSYVHAMRAHKRTHKED